MRTDPIKVDNISQLDEKCELFHKLLGIYVDELTILFTGIINGEEHTNVDVFRYGQFSTSLRFIPAEEHITSIRGEVTLSNDFEE